VRNKALSGLAVPSREGHEGVPLIFDVCVLGFYKWSRGRLRLLGYDPIPSPYRKWGLRGRKASPFRAGDG